ncbi:MAG: 3-oxoacyl-[acyl-carrier-protein] synthase 3 [Actinomycetota bacterium]|jgi:3-oxoacyl-[acyl-carrier-protein] synthase-3|nr:MAG: 3-oxoacyl-[acyl-carrier-protein] synthase 3 [Actinomycetota bacterium]
MTRHATITGVGSYLPPRLVPNAWFEDKVDTTDAWIRERTGIRARHFVEDGVLTSDLAVEAARRALATAGIEAEQLDLIVCATVTGDTPFPATAVWVQRKLGLSCPAFDVNAACAGFSYALASASAMVEAGIADTVLLLGAEVFSRILDFTDRSTCVLFGDGAGAAIVRASERPGIEGTVLGADGSAAEVLIMPGGGSREPASPATVAAGRHRIFMPNGREVFKRAVTEMASACRQVLEKNGHAPEDVDVLIPHQANERIMRAVAERLRIPEERAVLDVAEVGNTSAASIPIALDRAWRAGRIRPGDLVLFTSFGAGLTWGATSMRWTMPAPEEVAG